MAIPVRIPADPLKQQVAEVSSQIVDAMENTPSVNGYMEIGYPGRFQKSLKRPLNIGGRTYAMTDAKRFTDYLQTGFPRPYKQHVCLNEYDPIPEKKVPSGSLDLITCLIGLHHVPQEKLDPFVASLARTLRRGGSFVLRDHDVTTPELDDLVHTVHSVFNAATGENETTEREEVRNFKPLTYWTALLKRHGFEKVSDGYVREGDPTLNSIIRFVKRETEVEKEELQVSALTEGVSGYERSQLRTYLNTPEWHIVDISKEYSDSLEHTPFYNFPYFKHIKGYWKVFRKSWKVGVKEKGVKKVLFSPETTMNIATGSFLTVEYGLKGILCSPISWWYGLEANKDEAAVMAVVRSELLDLSKVDERIVEMDQGAGQLHLIQIPRYKPFREVLVKLAHEGIEVLEIGGAKAVQFKLKVPKDDQRNFTDLSGCDKLYEWPIHSDTEYKYVAMKVQLESLCNTVNYLEEHSIEFTHIFDI